MVARLNIKYLIGNAESANRGSDPALGWGTGVWGDSTSRNCKEQISKDQDVSLGQTYRSLQDPYTILLASQ